MRLSIAIMSGLLTYAMVMWFCAVCRVRALGLSNLSASGAFADVHRSFRMVLPCVQKNVISWLVHRSSVLHLVSSHRSRRSFACVMLHCYFNNL
jgi:hypothetical protein